ncbi:hypothetical protein BU26DRAFT_573063 [Trematosphaeria pertusa]|uniref:Uncharacterized protein n=1 Tax=Trematosphaeria pertusa TaxID=390896 RepID=A0A6A6HQM7_9PLEO|nr:uncharacterized protein BU26DRAFT_573063 [Trematosphaeria pertusa]KAF2240179.1 hypothetical protein BU26DRAFT_573063 [Trematosphaeria pertusa]
MELGWEISAQGERHLVGLGDNSLASKAKATNDGRCGRRWIWEHSLQSSLYTQHARHMADAFTKTTALFSCAEVKLASGDHTETEYQLSVWMAASLRKKNAACAAHRTYSGINE